MSKDTNKDKGKRIKDKNLNIQNGIINDQVDILGYWSFRVEC